MQVRFEVILALAVTVVTVDLAKRGRGVRRGERTGGGSPEWGIQHRFRPTPVTESWDCCSLVHVAGKG